MLLGYISFDIGWGQHTGQGLDYIQKEKEENNWVFFQQERWQSEKNTVLQEVNFLFTDELGMFREQKERNQMLYLITYPNYNLCYQKRDEGLHF